MGSELSLEKRLADICDTFYQDLNQVRDLLSDIGDGTCYFTPRGARVFDGTETHSDMIRGLVSARNEPELLVLRSLVDEFEKWVKQSFDGGCQPSYIEFDKGLCFWISRWKVVAKELRTGRTQPVDQASEVSTGTEKSNKGAWQLRAIQLLLDNPNITNTLIVQDADVRVSASRLSHSDTLFYEIAQKVRKDGWGKAEVKANFGSQITQLAEKLNLPWE